MYYYQKYCDEVGLCVTVTDTWFIYKDGNEPGLIIGFISFFAENHRVRLHG